MTRARDALPAIALAIAGLGAVSAATLAPRPGYTAAIFFSERMPASERVVRIAQLGGRIVDASAAGRVAYAAFDAVPGFSALWASGVVAVIDAAGAAGCEPLGKRLAMAVTVQG